SGVASAAAVPGGGASSAERPLPAQAGASLAASNEATARTHSISSDRTFMASDPLRCPPHALDPQVQREHDRDERDAAAPDSGAVGELVADEAEREVLAGERDCGGNQHAEQAFADDHARREQHAELLGGLGLAAVALGAAVVEPADDG